MIIRTGISGIELCIDDTYRLAGQNAIIAGDGPLTGQRVSIMGCVPRFFVASVAVELVDSGQVTVVPIEQLELGSI